MATDGAPEAPTAAGGAAGAWDSIFTIASFKPLAFNSDLRKTARSLEVAGGRLGTLGSEAGLLRQAVERFTRGFTRGMACTNRKIGKSFRLGIASLSKSATYLSFAAWVTWVIGSLGLGEYSYIRKSPMQPKKK